MPDYGIVMHFVYHYLSNKLQNTSITYIFFLKYPAWSNLEAINKYRTALDCMTMEPVELAVANHVD